MTLTLRQRWRLFCAGFCRQQHLRELRTWLALKTTAELFQLYGEHGGPAVLTELRRRGVV